MVKHENRGKMSYHKKVFVTSFMNVPLIPVAEQTNFACDPSLMFMSVVLCLSEISGGITTSKFATCFNRVNYIITWNQFRGIIRAGANSIKLFPP